MTWFDKTFACCATLLLAGFIIDILGSNKTLYMCKRTCKDEPDGHLCSRRMSKTDGTVNGKPFPRYRWLRNECERKCFMGGEYEKVIMEDCIKNGQNHTTYRCDDYGHPSAFQRCMRNETMEY